MVGPWRMEAEFIIKDHDELFTIVEKIKERFPQNILNIEYTIFRNEVYFPAGLFFVE